MKTYKDLDVYKRAYKVAIDFHLYLKGGNDKLDPEQVEHLKLLSRDVLRNIADSFKQRTSRAKRFFNFKALDACHRIMMDLEFLKDIKALPEEGFNTFFPETEICAKQIYRLNQAILETAPKANKEPVKA